MLVSLKNYHDKKGQLEKYNVLVQLLFEIGEILEKIEHNTFRVSKNTNRGGRPPQNKTKELEKGILDAIKQDRYKGPVHQQNNR